MQTNQFNSGLGETGDAIRPLTQIVAGIIIPFLVAAFVILFFFPGESGRRFAWEIKPAMTAIWMGAGYLGGAYFFLRVMLEKRWSRVANGFWPVTAFTWSMLAATGLHWSRFDAGHLPFQIWLVLYLVTPFLVPYVCWRNQAAGSSQPEPGEVMVPGWARLGMAVIGLLMMTSFVICYVAPNLAIAFWPWPLTPLTARVMGGWFALMGVGGFVMAREARWSAWRYQVESIIFVWHALVLLGAFIYQADFKPTGLWFVSIEAAAILAFSTLYLVMESKKRPAQRAEAT